MEIARLPNLVFPRLAALTVSHFEPYVRGATTSFTHSFPPGVNVIVGINGLGKTTLLNVIFRLLVGPFDPAKADRIRPGRKQSSITRTKPFDFFRKRANDEAVQATASATYFFGKRKVQITRSLYDLRLISYSLDGHETITAIDPVTDDDRLMDILCGLMNLEVIPSQDDELPPHRYDFDFVVRNLVFFLEEKIPLIWNPDGQFVILRILLLESGLSSRIAGARNQLLKLDSLYRNKLWAYNSLRAQYEDRLKEVGGDAAVFDDLNLLGHEVQNLEYAAADLTEQRKKLMAEIDRVENELLQARAEEFQAQMMLRDREASYFNQAFRRVRSPGDLILQALASHEGCLVCGNHEENTVARARELLESDHCPVCESDIATAEENVSEIGPVQLGRVREAEIAAAAARQRLVNLKEAERRLGEDYHDTNERLIVVTSNLAHARRREDSEASKARMTQELIALQKRVDADTELVAEIRADLDGAIAHHESLIRESRQFIEAKSGELIETFNRYAAEFMVEECSLRFVPDHRAKVAQADSLIDWPAFEVELASGADAKASRREWASEVSESQKEFIDLSFRMALLHVASDGAASMLAIETPEASLDVFFVKRAGRLLREYASTSNDNMLLVTSNLTKEEMIAQLVGRDEGDETLEQRRKRTLNLLEIARPTKAYKMNGPFYDAEFARSIGDEVTADPAPPSKGSAG